jgi:hypothetical protein
MAAATAGRSRSDRLWTEAAAQLASDGVIEDRAVAELLQTHDRLQVQERERSRRSALIELAGYSGAALAVVGTAAISSQVWQEVDAAAQVFLLGLLGVALLTAGAVIARTTPSGPAALRSVEQAPRRRLVGVLGVAGAALMAAAVGVGLDSGLSDASREQWTWLVPATALAIAAAVHAVAPGVVPTLAIGGSLPATVLLALNGLGWLDPVWAAPLALLGIAVLGAVVLVRVLPPAILVEAVAVAAWLATAASLLGMGQDEGAPQSETTTALWLGRIGLVALIGLGAWRFWRGGSWPWAVAVAAGSAALIGLTFAEALGGAIAMTIAGIILILTSVLLLRTGRRSPPEDPLASAPAP